MATQFTILGSAIHAGSVTWNVNINTNLYGIPSTDPAFCVGVVVPDNFVGRVDELRRLKNAIPKKPYITVISGLGGIGKTQLAKQFVFLNRTSYKNVIWINSQKLDEEFNGLAVKMNIITESQKSRDFNSIAQEVFNRLSASPTLMIFDNADKIEDCKFVFTMGTLGDKPHIIITSRIQEWSTSIHNIKLRVFEPADAVEYVSKTLIDPDNPFDDRDTSVEIGPSNSIDTLEDKKKLVEKLQYFPLALRQATAHINDQRISKPFCIDDYIINYNTQSKVLLDSKVFQNDVLNTYEMTTFTTWKVSMDAIDQYGKLGDLALRILLIIAFFDPDHIVREIFYHLNCIENTDVEETVIKAVRLLVNYSMVDSQKNQSVLNIHRLVQQVIRIELINVDGMTQHILRDGLILLSKTDQNLKEIQEHATSVFTSALSFDDLVREFKTFLTTILRSLIDCGLYSMAYNFGKQALPPMTNVLGEQDENTLSSMSIIARSHREMGRDSEAIELFKKVVERRTQISDEYHPDTLSAQSGIAFSYRDQARHSEALIIFQDVFEKRKKTLGELHPDTLVSKCNIAQSYRSMGKYAESYEMSKEVLKEQTEILGEDHPNTLITRTNIARSCRDLGTYNEALKIFEEVFEKQKSILGEDHPNTLVSKNNIARTYLNLKKPSEALEMFQEILEKRKQILGEEHPNTILCKSKIGNTYLSLGRNSEALEIFIEILEKRKQILGEEHPDTIAAMSSVAHTYLNLDRNSEAIQLFEEVFQKRKQILGDNHRDTISSKSNVALSNRNMGNYSEALRLFEEVYEKRREISGENHPVTITYRTYIEEIKQSIEKNKKCVLC